MPIICLINLFLVNVLIYLWHFTLPEFIGVFIPYKPRLSKNRLLIQFFC